MAICTSQFDDINDYKSLHAYLAQRLKSKSVKHYILLDEVQQVSQWEKTINALMVDANVDIYITGSNAYLLSSELSVMSWKISFILNSSEEATQYPSEKSVF